MPHTRDMNSERDAVAHNVGMTIAMGSERFNARTRDRIGGSDLAMMRRYLVANGAVCASCGLPVDTNEQGSTSIWGHLVPATFFGGKGGWIEGNVVIMCVTCNNDAGDTMFTPDMLARPDVALLAWPKRGKALREATPVSNRAQLCRDSRPW